MDEWKVCGFQLQFVLCVGGGWLGRLRSQRRQTLQFLRYQEYHWVVWCWSLRATQEANARSRVHITLITLTVASFRAMLVTTCQSSPSWNHPHNVSIGFQLFFNSVNLLMVEGKQSPASSTSIEVTYWVQSSILYGNHLWAQFYWQPISGKHWLLCQTLMLLSPFWLL